MVLLRLKTDKKAAFERLFVSMYPHLVRYSVTLVGDKCEAQDIVNDAFEKAWKIFSAADCDSMKGWLYASVRNASLNRLKHLGVEHANIAALAEATRHDMETDYSEHEALLQRAEAVARSLSEPACTILRLCYYEKKTYRQAAEQLGVSPDTIKKYISKALSALREELKNKI